MSNAEEDLYGEVGSVAKQQEAQDIWIKQH